MKIAIVGAGVSGLVVGRLLAVDHEVTIYESGDWLGGHAHTHEVNVGGERAIVDTGFMVFNEKTYPNFCRMLKLLGVKSRDSDMSFSFRSDSEQIEYQGGNLSGLFAQASNLVRPAFWSMIRDIIKFNREATRFATRERDQNITVGEWLAKGGYGESFRRWYLRPMAAAIWSAKQEEIDRFPAHFMLGFFANHGLLQLSDRPQWKTIVGGAKSYVEALVEPIHSSIRLSDPVEKVLRHNSSAVVLSKESEEEYDAVVMACHADQALELLADADDGEQEFLSAFPYQKNLAILHTDKTQMPRSQRAWASWNYRAADSEVCDSKPVAVTYHLNRLQGVEASQELFVTLNPVSEIDERCVLKRIEYAHPCFTNRSIAAQKRLQKINGERNTYFCGAYCGYGFHEDGVRSALAIAARFKLSMEDLSRKVPQRAISLGVSG